MQGRVVGQHLQLLLDLGVLGFQAIILPLVLLQGQPHAARHLHAPQAVDMFFFFLFFFIFYENPPTINSCHRAAPQASPVSKAGGCVQDAPHCPSALTTPTVHIYMEIHPKPPALALVDTRASPGHCPAAGCACAAAVSQPTYRPNTAHPPPLPPFHTDFQALLNKYIPGRRPAAGCARAAGGRTPASGPPHQPPGLPAGHLSPPAARLRGVPPSSGPQSAPASR